jgi:hypothetical protein
MLNESAVRARMVAVCQREIKSKGTTRRVLDTAEDDDYDDNDKKEVEVED